MEDRERTWRRTGHPDVDRDIVTHSTGGGVTRAYQSTTDGICPDGHNYPGVRHGFIGRPKRAGHADRAGTGHDQEVGMARAGGKEYAEPVDVVDGPKRAAISHSSEPSEPASTWRKWTDRRSAPDSPGETLCEERPKMPWFPRLEARPKPDGRRSPTRRTGRSQKDRAAQLHTDRR